jgi:hypothetical protein
VASKLGVPHEQRYWVGLIGLALYGLIWLLQKPRVPKPTQETISW